MTSNTNNKSSSLQSTASIAAGLSAALIGILQFIFPNSPKEMMAIGSSIIPLIVTFIVSILQWCFVKWGFKTTSEMASENILDERINFLRAQIDIEKQASRNVTELEKSLNDAILAKAKLYEVEANRIGLHG